MDAGQILGNLVLVNLWNNKIGRCQGLKLPACCLRRAEHAVVAALESMLLMC